jgi:uncharacterized protein (DUF58 family)
MAISDKNKEHTLSVKLTARIAVYAAVLAVSALPAIFTNTAAGYMFALIVLLAGIASAICFFAVRHKISQMNMNTGITECQRLDTRDITISISNRSRFAFAILSAEFRVATDDGLDARATKVRFTLAPREEHVFAQAVEFRHIGVYTAELRGFTIRDYLGLFQCKLDFDSRMIVRVLPREIEVDMSELSDDASAESPHSVSSAITEGSDYSGVREYAYGDPIKNIHWKLSAHAAGYLTKMRESTASGNVCVVLGIPSGTDEIALDIFDKLVEFTAAAASEARKRGLDCVITFLDGTGEPKRAVPGAFSDIGDLVSDLPRTSETGGDAERLLQGSMSEYGNIIVCAPEESPELSRNIQRLRQMKKNVLLFTAGK